MKKSKHIGGSFDDYLNKKGIYNEVDDVAMHKVLAWQVNEAMKEAGITKTEMARRMKTSRSSLDRLLDPNKKTTFATVEKAAKILGKRIVVELL